MALMSKCKDPPRYEDAVKQTRCMQTAMQVKQTFFFFASSLSTYIVDKHLLRIPHTYFFFHAAGPQHSEPTHGRPV